MKKDLVGRVERITVEKDKLAKVVADLEAWLKDSESSLEESKLKSKAMVPMFRMSFAYFLLCLILAAMAM